MGIFSLLFISSLLALLELSVLPYFKLFDATPFLLIPFFVILSVKYKGLFHLFLALIFGIVFDFATVGVFGKFTFIFLITVILGRLLFYRDSSYDTSQSFFILLVISTLLVYSSQLYLLYTLNFNGWQNFLLITILGLVYTLICGLVIYRLSGKYIDWLNKKHDESYK